jgi:hypothetical protein
MNLVRSDPSLPTMPAPQAPLASRRASIVTLEFLFSLMAESGEVALPGMGMR